MDSGGGHSCDWCPCSFRGLCSDVQNPGAFGHAVQCRHSVVWYRSMIHQLLSAGSPERFMCPRCQTFASAVLTRAMQIYVWYMLSLYVMTRRVCPFAGGIAMVALVSSRCVRVHATLIANIQTTLNSCIWIRHVACLDMRTLKHHSLSKW